MALPTGGYGVPDSINVPYVLVHNDGLEIYDTQLLQGLQITPAELHLQVPLEGLPGPEKEPYESRATNPCSNKTPVLKSTTVPKKRQSWKLWLSIIAGACLIVALAIAIALGLHYSKDSSRSSAKPVEPASNTSATPIPPTSRTPNASNLTPQTLSTSGAFNGTSLATFNGDVNQELVTHLFYQDYQGQLRRVEKDGSQWSGGPAIAPVVSSSAKNATPIACANYTDTTTNAQKANLFYVDPTNMLQEVISTDNFQTWQTGTLGNSALQISPSAFAMNSFYLPESGLRLYYGGVDGLVHEIVYISGDGIWSEQFRFESSNGNGGICHSIYDENPGLAQLYMLDTQNNFRVWNLSITPTVISNWTLDPSPANVTSVAVNSSLASAIGAPKDPEAPGTLQGTFIGLGLGLSNNSLAQIKTFGVILRTDLSMSPDIWEETLNVTFGDPRIALPRFAIAAAAESLDLAGIYNLTLLPV
ncbi:hypothetical protein JMJ35_004479 [Cladonia borealis]|uniref:Fucose-specific lectin n=1 Tax=Cladonia borealis TaxID=184061 RepID=A0AA39V2H9_9LECA|nr:hypothetical protein JMJ35_004479 [Cladonia borealis]